MKKDTKNQRTKIKKKETKERMKERKKEKKIERKKLINKQSPRNKNKG